MSSAAHRILFVVAWFGTLGFAVPMNPRAALFAADRVPETAPRFVGAGSCAAAACHGGPVGRDPRTGALSVARGEYTVWIQNDPHASAYTALFNRQSKAIAEKLGLPAAHKAAVCLNCHAPISESVDSTEIVESDRRVAGFDGVSCESCHGGAEKWLEPHKRSDWRNPPGSAQNKLELGFNDTTDPLKLADKCVRCHVGSPGRDVDHDLIAAGHPRLYFEMSAYLEKMPHHWDAPKDPARDVEREPRLWAVGQFVAAEGAVNLLQYRASQKHDLIRPEKPAAWPEFAESACFACHHDLAHPSWRREAESGDRKGEPLWGSWHFALVEELARTLESPEKAKSLEDDRRILTREMARPIPEKRAACEAASRLGITLHGLAGTADRKVDFSDAESAVLLSLLLESAGPKKVRDWESSTQVYLGLVAVSQSRRRQGAAIGPPASSGDLGELRNLLRFPQTKNGTKHASPEDFDSSRIRDLETALERLRRNGVTR